MKYRFHRAEMPLKQLICQISAVDPQDLDVSSFSVDYNLKIISEFKEKLLSNKDKRFFIVGDYDCDGICAVTIMKLLLDDLKISSNFYIPSRTKEGYGLNSKIVDTAAEHGFGVLLCVDNGIVCSEELEYASKRGLKTFVIDHHEYQKLPETDGILHPDLFPDEYRDMCAAGICTLLSNSFRYDELSSVYGGLATLADMVSVLGYNRYLLKNMVTILKEKQILPINYLLSGNPVDYESLSFNVIPKINAVSRLDDLFNVNYLVYYLADNSKNCLKYLNKIEEVNNLRKELSKSMSAAAERMADPEASIIVVASKAFKEGLCGLIANRLMNQYDKPVLVFAVSDDLYTGSGRCPKGGDLYTYLSRHKELFNAFGGHAQAVGLSISAEQFEDFVSALRSDEFECDEADREVILFNQNDLNEEILDELEELKPFGSGFEEPLLGIEDVSFAKKYTVARRYPKYVLNDKLEAISFNSDHLNKDFTMMLGHLQKDRYHRDKLSFVIEDLLGF